MGLQKPLSGLENRTVSHCPEEGVRKRIHPQETWVIRISLILRIPRQSFGWVSRHFPIRDSDKRYLVYIFFSLLRCSGRSICKITYIYLIIRRIWSWNVLTLRVSWGKNSSSTQAPSSLDALFVQPTLPKQFLGPHALMFTKFCAHLSHPPIVYRP